MKAYEYVADVSSEGHLSVPKDLKDKLSKMPKVRVMLFLEDDEESWNRLARSEFLKGYSEKDSVYDGL